MLTEETSKQKQSLLQLLISDDLAELNAKSKDEFNIFKVLKLQNNEVKHSNFLGWLLTPFESHKLMDNFLKEFFKIALRNDTSLVDIILKDLTDAKITLEKMINNGQRMDIFIDCPTNKLVCVIENKVWAGEHDNQLENYRNYVLNHEKYKDYEYKIFLFLTPYEYSNCEDYKGYIRINYGDILKAINNLMKQWGCLLNDDVKMFIEHYTRMIERNIMGEVDKEIVDLCRKIYRENKEAIDLIVENANSGASKISETLWNIVKDTSDLQTTGFYNNEFIEFFQKEIATKYNYQDLKTDEQLRIYYLFWQKNRKVDFILWVRQGSKEQRQVIHDILAENSAKLSENNMVLNKFCGNSIEKMITVSFIGEEEYQYFEDMNEDDLKLELTKRFKNIYEQKIKCLQEIFRENISKLP